MLASTQKKFNHEILKLKKNVPTRWNSSFDMMNRFIKNKIPILSCVDSLKMKTHLSPTDWVIIEQSF